ncbi:MAG: GNAT family N-acetyltransferase [Muribaculaceae bacterium]|nr:GNAT family N-acetyltransferase [Muribaculaceae bacterium]
MTKIDNSPIVIRPGRIEDAPFIGKTITEAMGHELCVGLAECEENVPNVLKLFTDLAASETSQYSYRNALVAVDKDDNRIGAIIGYDGAGLREMRKDFISKANELLGWNVTFEEADNWEPETNDREIYLDSLYVIPEYRNQGIASSLIKAAIEKYRNIGKPFGLLVEPHNIKAHKLYKELGFKEDGVNNFCGEPMIHLSYSRNLRP